MKRLDKIRIIIDNLKMSSTKMVKVLLRGIFSKTEIETIKNGFENLQDSHLVKAQTSIK